MEPKISEAQAAEIAQALEGIRMLIQFSLGQNQALLVALGSALAALPADAPPRLQALSDLESWRTRMRADPQSLGLLDGFDATSAALATAMGVEPPAPAHTKPPAAH